MSWAAVIVGGSAIVGGAISYAGASKAADAGGDAADNAAEVTWDMYRQGREDLAPWREAGAWALGSPSSTTVSNAPQYDAQVSGLQNELAALKKGAPQYRTSGGTFNRYAPGAGGLGARGYGELSRADQKQYQTPTTRTLTGYGAVNQEAVDAKQNELNALMAQGASAGGET
ncbi:unnamed protein product, partial [marine sediment metagenome]